MLTSSALHNSIDIGDITFRQWHKLWKRNWKLQKISNLTCYILYSAPFCYLKILKWFDVHLYIFIIKNKKGLERGCNTLFSSFPIIRIYQFYQCQCKWIKVMINMSWFSGVFSPLKLNSSCSRHSEKQIPY